MLQARCAMARQLPIRNRRSAVVPATRRLPTPLRGMRPDLAKLARQLETEVEQLWATAERHETAGRELEALFTELKVHVAEVASGGAGE